MGEQKGAEGMAASKREGQRATRAVRKRVQLNVIVSAETKQLIERLARESDRSQGQVAEALIERSIVYDSVIAAMNRTLDDIRRGHIEEAFRSDGYTPLKTPYGQIWVPRDFPLTGGSNWKLAGNEQPPGEGENK